MPIKQSSRPYFEEMRMLARDIEGREILIGLTYDESEWYLDYAEKAQQRELGKDSRSLEQRGLDRQRYLELHDRHEAARLQIIAAEAEARQHPTRN